MNITKELAAKVLEVVDAGLVRGVGNPVAGQMCVEAAVCFALGEPHGDQPSCVGFAVRAFKTRLNDARWSSNAARSKGMRGLAIAQLGSDTIDQRAFTTAIVIGTVREVLPRALRLSRYNGKFEPEAQACEEVSTLAGAKTAAGNARKVTAVASAYAAYAADAAAASADAAAAYAAAAYAAAAAAALAAAYAAAATDAAAAGTDADAAAADEILTVAANLGLRVLVDLKSPGANFLGLLE